MTRRHTDDFVVTVILFKVGTAFTRYPIDAMDANRSAFYVTIFTGSGVTITDAITKFRTNVKVAAEPPT